MKIRAKYPEYQVNSPNMPAKSVKSAKTIGFEGNSAVSETPRVDKILKKGYVQKLFKIAQQNPHAFNLINLAALGIVLRPATVLVIPGAEKEDKQYVAAKSLIGTVLIVASQLLISIPLGNAIERLGKAAEKNPKIPFFKFGSKKFDAYNFLISNAVGLAVTLASSSFLTVKLTTKIMNKLLPQKSHLNKDTQSLKGKERVA